VLFNSPSITSHDLLDDRVKLFVCCIILFETILSTKIAINAKLLALGTSEVVRHRIVASRRRTGVRVYRRHNVEPEAVKSAISIKPVALSDDELRFKLEEILGRWETSCCLLYYSYINFREWNKNYFVESLPVQ
jgi:hypothetical protein